MPIAYIVIGCSGSGKSGLAHLMAKKKPDLVLISRDGIRSELAKKLNRRPVEFVFDESLQAMVTNTFRRSIERNSRKGKDIIIDATNLTPHARAEHMGWLQQPYTKIALVFKPDLDLLLHNNGQRNIRWALQLLNGGNEDIAPLSFRFIERQFRLFMWPTKEEGFSRIERRSIEPVINLDFAGVRNLAQAQRIVREISCAPCDIVALKSKIERNPRRFKSYSTVDMHKGIDDTVKEILGKKSSDKLTIEQGKPRSYMDMIANRDSKVPRRA